jgi:hypothetical protein
MATPPSDDSKMLFRLLADEGWHNYYEIKAAIAEKVPPGRAIRKYQERLRQSREMRGTVNVENARNEDEQIRLGAMACAQVALTSWKGKGIMSRGEGQWKEIRVKPGFQSWGMTTADAGGGAQEPPERAGGSPEVPPGDSEPSEVPRATAESPPGPIAEPAAVEVPEVRPEPAAVEQPVPAPEPAAEAVPEPAMAQAGLAAPVEELIPGPSTRSPYVTGWTGPACPECHMAITDLELHEQWHRDLKSAYESPNTAYLDSEELKTLLGDVTRQAMARFQAGMQIWMEERFTQLEAQIRLLQKDRDPLIPWSETGYIDHG